MCNSPIPMTTLCFLETTSESTAIVQSMLATIYACIGRVCNIDCIFLSSSTEVRRMSLRLEDREVFSIDECGQFTHRLNNTSWRDTGHYQCVVELKNGTIRRTEAGNLGIIGELNSKLLD